MAVQEKAKGFLEKGKRWWTNTKTKTKALMAVGLLVVIAVVGVVIALQQNQPYVTLFTDLNQTDLNSIVTYLSDNGVTDYQISGNDTVLVPEDQEVQLKADLVMQGYPKSGYAYSTYLDNVGALTTESERNQLVLYELQDRTAAVIRSMDGVQDATVSFTPGEDRTYVLDSGNIVEASAYVKVTMEDGATLSDTMAKGIRNLVGSSLQGLQVDNVTIVDSYGNTYLNDDALADAQDLSDLKLRLEEQVNHSLESKILQVLVPIYGQDNVRVSVNSVVDVDRTYTDSTDYNLEDWANDGSTNGEGIIGTKIYDNSYLTDDTDTAGGTAGTATNADVPEYSEDTGDTENPGTILESSGQTDYLVDQKNQQVEHVAGTVADVMVSVSINGNTDSGVAEEDLYSHVGRAAGISAADQAEKIHILVAPFYQPTQDGENAVDDGAVQTSWVLYAGLGGIVLFLLILLLVLLLARRSRKKRLARAAAELQAAVPAQPAEAAGEGANIMEMETEKSMELRKDVRKFAEENPEIAAQMVKNWLKEGAGTE